MAQVRVEDRDLVIEVEGLDKLWSLRSSLTIPLRHVRGASEDSGPITHRAGIRVGGTRVPGVITAGTFHQDGEKIFWNVHNAPSVLVIELHDETYVRLVIEVPDPRATARLINGSISTQRTHDGQQNHLPRQISWRPTWRKVILR